MNAMIRRGLSLLQKSIAGEAAALLDDSPMPSLIRNDSTPDASLGERIHRSLVLGLLQHVRGGRLVIFEQQQMHSFGKKCDADYLNASITVHDDALWPLLVTRGSVGAGEAYMAGHWSSPDLTEVIRLFARNRDILQGMDGQQSLLARLAMKAAHAMNRNTPEGARKNIGAHYDLSNEFFQLFLDPEMMYSSAIFRYPTQPLAEASLHKLDHICQQLQLKPGDRLLEIGTGWGGMAIHAAKHYGCHVTTTTISQQQYLYAQERIVREGLAHRITLLQQDYRDLQGEYDKLVSIEMIEAVGAEFQQQYFETCDRLLKPGGLALIQAITLPNDRYAQYLSGTDFIRQYIFPGGCLPTTERMLALTGEHTSLQLIDKRDLTLDYARTLQHWRQRFLFQLRQVMAMGFDLSFIRMWEFYLCFCEGGFLEGSIGTEQWLLQKAATAA